jgi:hypothetical protein
VTAPPQGANVRVDALIAIVTFRHEQDNKPSALILRWSELVARLTRHDMRAVKDGPAWSPVTYRNGAKRAKANVDQVHALVLDVDHVELPYERLTGLARVAHTTHSQNPPADPRWRVVIPLAQSVPGDEESWSIYWLRARERFGEAMDEACKDASRMYFWLACRPRAPHQTEFGDGELLDPDSLPNVRNLKLSRPPTKRLAWSGDIKAYARKALEDEIAKVVAAPPGGGSTGTGRNVQLNKSAFCARSAGRRWRVAARPRRAGAAHGSRTLRAHQRRRRARDGAHDRFWAELSRTVTASCAGASATAQCSATENWYQRDERQGISRRGRRHRSAGPTKTGRATVENTNRAGAN